MIKRHSLLIALALAITGAGLIILSYVHASSRTEINTQSASVAPGPAPTWAPVPTRVLATVSAPAEPVRTEGVLEHLGLERALLQGDLVGAEQAWQAMRETPLSASSTSQKAGARLALMQGDFGSASLRAWRAIVRQPQQAQAWSLLGLILKRAGQPQAARRAFEIAQSLDPDLASLLFQERWRIAYEMGDTGDLAALAEGYRQQQPESDLRPYYDAAVLLLADGTVEAIELLGQALQSRPTSPALLWYQLGEAYLQNGNPEEAALVLEVAARQFARGDSSLYLISEEPLIDLSIHLAKAYLVTERCTEAEQMLSRLLGSRPDLEVWVERAAACETSIPTPLP